MKRLYGNLKMSWPTVILFALATGIYTGIVLLLDVFKDTSFQDIGIAYEWWMIFAVIIVVNCEKSWEAMLKCFVFFLISQPVVYAVEIAFGPLTIQLALNYYLSFWFMMTFLTLPGGFIAFYCKKQNALGAVILGLGNTLQLISCVSYFGSAVKDFPHHILSGIVCLASVFITSFYIQEKKKYRLMSIIFAFVLAAVLIVWGLMAGRHFW